MPYEGSIKRTASAGPRRVTGLSSEGLEGGDQHRNPSVSPRGQLCRESRGLEHVCAHMLFTACVHKDVCLCPPMMHLVFAGSGWWMCVFMWVQTSLRTGRHQGAASLSVWVHLCRWDARVSEVLGARVKPTWGKRPSPLLHLSKESQECSWEGQS